MPPYSTHRHVEDSGVVSPYCGIPLLNNTFRGKIDALYDTIRKKQLILAFHVDCHSAYI